MELAQQSVMNVSSCVIPVSYSVTQTEGFLFVSAGQRRKLATYEHQGI